jgi:hypothetical protein
MNKKKLEKKVYDETNYHEKHSKKNNSKLINGLSCGLLSFILAATSYYLGKKAGLDSSQTYGLSATLTGMLSGGLGYAALMNIRK